MSIRLRLALVFTLAAAVLFSLGGLLFENALSSGLLSKIDSQLATEAAQVKRLVKPVTSTGSNSSSSNSGPLSGEFLLQIIDTNNKVRRSSVDAGTVPLLNTAQLGRARTRSVSVTTSNDGEHARTLGTPYSAHAGWVTIASVSLDAYDKTLHDVFLELLVGGLAFAAVAGFGSYGLARAALSPVERLRREVATLSERDEDASVQVPGTHDELAALATTMNELLGRLHGSLARQRAFVADASHELRTPFAVLRGELELAGRPGRTREELVAAVASAAEEAGRLNRLTDDLLVLARSDSDRLTLRLTATDVGGVLARSAEFAKRRAHEAGITVRIDAPPMLVAEVDADRLRQAVDNLLDNAIRFSPRGSTVVVAARGAGSTLHVEVRDEGPGFPKDFLPHAFERFRRPDSGRARSDGGAGLGLAIVAAIAAAHGGRALGANAPGGGAVVSIELPRALAGRGAAPSRD